MDRVPADFALPPQTEYQLFRRKIAELTEDALRKRRDIHLTDGEALPHVLHIVNAKRPFGAPLVAGIEAVDRWIVAPPYEAWESQQLSHAACFHKSFSYNKTKWSAPRGPQLRCDACGMGLTFTQIVNSSPDAVARLARALDIVLDMVGGEC